MKPASVNEIKQKLKETDKKELIEICQRLARFKKENKELLTYLLFEEDDLPNYIKNVKEEIDEGFSQINISNVYFAKKNNPESFAHCQQTYSLHKQQNSRNRNPAPLSYQFQRIKIKLA